MKRISLSEFGPIISDQETGKNIYKKINDELSDPPVILNLESIKSMATFCAKQIFGRLYVELGSEAFFEKIQFEDTSEDLKAIIKIGIQSALDEIEK